MNPEAQSQINKVSPISPSRPELNKFLVLIPISLRPILMLSSHLGLGLPKNLLPAGVPFKNFESIPSFFHSGYMTCPCQSSRLTHIDYIRCISRNSADRVLSKSIKYDITAFPVVQNNTTSNENTEDNLEHKIRSLKSKMK